MEEAPEAAHMVDLNIDSCPPTKHLKSARDEDNRAEGSQQKPQSGAFFSLTSLLWAMYVETLME